MKVTEVDISFVKPKDGLIAFASVVLDDQPYLSDIAIHSKLVGSGYRLTYPTRKVGGSPIQPLPSHPQACRAGDGARHYRQTEERIEQAQCWAQSH